MEPGLPHEGSGGGPLLGCGVCVPMDIVEFLVEYLLRARHCARPVHSPADSSLSTYCAPAACRVPGIPE